MSIVAHDGAQVAVLRSCLAVASRRGHPRFALVGRAWRIDGAGVLTLRRAGMAHFEVADREWLPLRPSDHQNQHWCWVAIGGRAAESWALEGEGGKLMALLSTQKIRVRLEGKSFFRLDYVEVAPAQRGTDVSALALAVAAYRAVELDRDGLLFASFPRVAPLYREFGFMEDIPKGWKHEPGLVGFVGWRSLLESIVEDANERLVGHPSIGEDS